jgi:hypothetical protein
MADEANTFEPRAAIAQFLARKMTGTQLLRGFATYRGWLVPARLAGMEPTYLNFQLGADSHFFLFTDHDAYMECRERVGVDVIGEFFIGNLFGHSAFSKIGPDVSIVNINPHCEHELHYKRDQIPRLRAWADILRAERALETVAVKNAGFDILKAFPGYYFIMEERQYLTLAPDGQGRRLAAVFTADDALETFLERNGKPSMTPVPIDGARLFPALRKMPLDGMVFNCSGPVRPSVFPLSFADEVIEKG